MTTKKELPDVIELTEDQAARLSAYNGELDQLSVDLDDMVRTHLLHMTIMMDEFIETTLAWHFCEDFTKHPLFFSLIFRGGEVTFSQKIIMLKKLLRDFYKDIYELLPGVFNKLEKIRELRNDFAHSKRVAPDSSRDLLPRDLEIQIEQYKDGKLITKTLTFTEYQKVVNMTSGLIKILAAIQVEVMRRAQKLDKPGDFKSLLVAIKKENPDILVSSKLVG